MCKSIVLALTLCSVLIGTTDCISSSSFDQRQTGDLNVQIGLKNINIIALLKAGKEEYVDYDYAYDYSEMTIKPPNGTTPKPLNATNTTLNIEMLSYANTTTAALEQTTEALITNTTTTVAGAAEVALNQAANSAVVSDIEPTADAATSIAPDSSNIMNVTDQPITNKCRRGFVQNNEGKCKYKVHETTNALRRIVKLAQKIKMGREYEGP